MKTQEMDYQDQGVRCVGYLAYDEKQSGKRPGILVVPAFEGRSELYMHYTEQLAKLGYVAMTVDMYGDAKVGHSIPENMNLLKPFFEDRALLRRRIMAAFELLKQQPQVDAGRIAGIGFCFGGMCVLDLARSGADVKAVVGFHSAFSTPTGVSLPPIKAKILLLHGYDDPMVPPSQLSAFAEEMKAAKAEWQCHLYGGVMHSFTDPKAVEVDIGRKFDPVIRDVAWAEMLAFIKPLL